MPVSEQGDDGDLNEDGGIECQIEERRVSATAVQDQRAQRTGRPHAERAAARSDQNGFGEQRSDDAAAARADGRADRNLVRARGPLRDHQDRDVRARNEQSQQHRCGQHIRQNRRNLIPEWRALNAG
jgi:hypothetical protein